MPEYKQIYVSHETHHRFKISAAKANQTQDEHINNLLDIEQAAADLLVAYDNADEEVLDKLELLIGLLRGAK